MICINLKQITQDTCCKTGYHTQVTKHLSLTIALYNINKFTHSILYGMHSLNLKRIAL